LVSVSLLAVCMVDVDSKSKGSGKLGGGGTYEYCTRTVWY
jgi:hypothetical protein